mgnify:CR=1 FL=1
MEIVDYSKYLSFDNGQGILISKSDNDVLLRYGFDVRKYSSLNNLIFDIDNYLNEVMGEEDLEDVLVRLSERYYYEYVKK